MPGSRNNNLTFMSTFNAEGEIVSPAIVFPYLDIPASIRRNVPSNFFVAGTGSGLMEASTFNDFICKVFHPWLGQENIRRPVILFVDGHKTSITMQVNTFCQDKGIILYMLPPNSEYILQPASMGPFKVIKEQWKVESAALKSKNFNSIIQRKDVAHMFNNILETLDRSSIIDGFQETGLYPLDPDSVNYSKCTSTTVRKDRFKLELDDSDPNCTVSENSQMDQDDSTADEPLAVITLKQEQISEYNYEDGARVHTDQCDVYNILEGNDAGQNNLTKRNLQSNLLLKDNYTRHRFDDEMGLVYSSADMFLPNNFIPDGFDPTVNSSCTEEDFSKALRHIGEILGSERMSVCVSASELGVSDDLYSLVNDIRTQMKPLENANTLRVISEIVDQRKMSICLSVSEMGVSADLYSVVHNIHKRSLISQSQGRLRLQILQEAVANHDNNKALLTHINMDGSGDFITAVAM